MATFISTQNGNWNDGGTWGNTSPGVEGTDYPSDGDDINIGHTVTYDRGNETDEYNALYILDQGTLTFPTNADSTLRMGSIAPLRVYDGGLLEVSTESNPINANYTVNIYFNNNDLTINSGGKVEAYGDPSFRTTRETSLSLDWDTGSIFTVEGDVTGDWEIGDILWVHRNEDYGAESSVYRCSLDYSSSGGYDFYTIKSLTLNGSNTEIEINEADPEQTFYSGGEVFNLEHNVIFADVSTTRESVNSRATTSWSSTIINYNGDTSSGYLKMDNVQIERIDQAISGNQYKTYISNASIFLCSHVFYQLHEAVINNVLIFGISDNVAYYSYGNTFTDVIIGGVYNNTFDRLFDNSGVANTFTNLQLINCYCVFYSADINDIDFENSTITKLTHSYRTFYSLNMRDKLDLNTILPNGFSNCYIALYFCYDTSFIGLNFDKGTMIARNSVRINVEISSVTNLTPNNEALFYANESCYFSGDNGSLITLDGSDKLTYSRCVDYDIGSTYRIDAQNWYFLCGHSDNRYSPTRFLGCKSSSMGNNHFESSQTVIYTGYLDGSELVDTISQPYCGYVIENSTIDTTYRDLVVITSAGTLTSIYSGETNFQTPPSGNSWVAEIVPAYYANKVVVNQLALYYRLSDFVSAGTQTLRFKIYPHGFTSLDGEDIYSELYYISGANSAYGYATSNDDTIDSFTNDSWQNIDIPFTQYADGVVYFNIFLAKYEVSSYLLIDPTWTFI